MIFLSVTFLSACATSPTINYISNPPNAIISYKTVGGGTDHYYTPRTVAYNINFDDGSCKEIDTPSARWPATKNYLHPLITCSTRFKSRNSAHTLKM